MNIFRRLEEGSDPSSLLFSWIPTPSRVRRLLAGHELYSLIRDIVNERKSTGRAAKDPLQVLIDQNFSLVEITRVS